MTLLVTIDLESSALETSVENAPDTDVLLEQRTMTPDGSIDATFWGQGRNLDAFEDGLDADRTVARWILVGGSDTWRLYRTRLSPPASSSMNYDGWADGRAVFHPTERTKKGWSVDALFPDHTVLQQFTEHCDRNDVTFDLLRVSQTDQLGNAGRFGLTELQAETLLAALEQGYYSIPRRANLTDLATHFDVSHQALSERLRRGVGSLVQRTIGDRQAGDSTVGASSRVSRTDTDLTSQEAEFRRSIAPGL